MSRVSAILVVVAISCGLVEVSRAGDIGHLVEVDLFSPGDRLITRDTTTGLEWLDLTESVRLSYTDVRTDDGDWISRGFRHATTAEVCAFFDHAFAPVPCPFNCGPFCPPNVPPDRQPAVTILETFLGTTTVGPVIATDGLFNDGNASDGVGLAGVEAPTLIFVMETSGPGFPTATDTAPWLGHFLVRVPTCGNGVIQPHEDCDDGNTDLGDGCSPACAVEPGYVCTGEPSRCATQCGDGIIRGDETCDDGNTESGDGCSSTCTVEPGFTCADEPSSCSICSDGIIGGAEVCDDGDVIAGDGCSSSCVIEAGFSCDGEPSICVLTCSNGLLDFGEECDDANTATGDGCSSTCLIEPGYVCVGEPSDCGLCGDAVVGGTEVCDDGNVTDGDGCDSTCIIESGFTCGGEPSDCSRCGDGSLGGTESCDDGNLSQGDGCDAGCAFEPNYMCSGDPSICVVMVSRCWKLWPGDFTGTDALGSLPMFGSKVDIENTTIVVAARGDDSGGAVYVFSRAGELENPWIEIRKLRVPSQDPTESLLVLVALDADTVVGGFHQLSGFNQPGTAAVFGRHIGGTDAWGEIARIVPSDPTGTQYPSSVAVDGDTVIVGNTQDLRLGFATGAAHVFGRDFGGTEVWGEEKKVLATDAAQGDFYGASVSISGSMASVGAHNAVYIHSRNSGGQGAWGEVAKIVSPPQVEPGSFGASVSMEGDTLVVGDSTHDAAYVFQKDAGGTDSWGQVAKLIPDFVGLGGPRPGRFGASVALSGDLILVGAPLKSEVRAHLFARDRGGPDAWGQVAALTVSEANNRSFGSSVALSGNTAILGDQHGDGAGGDDPSGVAWVCDLRPSADVCGDVDSSGALDLADAARLRGFLADPNLNALSASGTDRCSVIGTGTDCDIADVVVLRRALESPSLAPGIDPVCPAALVP